MSARFWSFHIAERKKPVQVTDSDSISISPASAEDVPTILSFIRGLAEYEKLSHACVATEEDLRRTLFGKHPAAEVLIARMGGKPVGYALFFQSYSTFLARPGIYLEDLFVLPGHRGRGAGKALLARVAQIAQARNCARLEWSVLDWNAPAIEFYQRLGASILPDWRICRMTPAHFAKLAGERG